MREDFGSTDTALLPSVSVRQGRLANGRTVAVSPIMVPFLNLYPVPGQGNTIVQDFGDTVLVAGALNQPTTNDFVLGKVDYQAVGGNTLSVTYNFDRGESIALGVLGEVSGSPSASGIASLGNQSKKQVVGTKWTTVLGGASLNEVHFGYSDTEPEGETPLSTRDWSALLFRPDRQFMGEVNVPGLTNIGYRTGSSS